MTSETTLLTLDRFTPDAKALVSGAQALADERRHPEVTPLHLLARCLERDAGAVAVLRRAGVRVPELASAVEQALAGIGRGQEPSFLSAGMLDLLERAQRDAERERRGSVGVEQLLNALSQEIRGAAGELLGAHGVAPGSLREHMAALTEEPARRGALPSGGEPARSGQRDLVALARAGRLPPVIGREPELRRLLTILARQAKSHPLLVGEAGVGKMAILHALATRLAAGDVPATLQGLRLVELELSEVLTGARLRGELEERFRKLLAGLSGAEEEVVVVFRGLEQLYVQGPGAASLGEVLRTPIHRGELRLLGTTTPEGLKRLEEKDPLLLRQLTQLSVEEPSLEQAIEIVRGAVGRFEAHHDVEIGETAVVAAVKLAKRYVQDRFLPDSALDLLDEAAARKRVETGAGVDAQGSPMSRLSSVEVQLAALANVDDSATRAARERLAAEAEQLRPVVGKLRESLRADRALHLELLATRRASAELDRRLLAARTASDAALVGELERRELPALKARLAAAEAAAETAGLAALPPIDEADVAATLALWTGIPVAKMLEGEAEKLLKMEQRLSERVIGQVDAVQAIARAVRRGRVGLRDPGRPIGSFLFLGPSGVGKTELAKALAEFLFDDEQALTRLDMSEFMERHMAQRLIGAPPGYADSDRGGFLTEAVRRRPYSVLLFDEVEKAHQDVFNLLLQVLDDGRLTDGRGRLADFSNTVVIMASNIGSARVLEASPQLLESEDGRAALKDVLLTELQSFFRPELLNRIDDVVVFRSLERRHLREIVELQLRRIARLIEDRQLQIELTEAAKDRLVGLGYEPALGARPLKRALLKHVQDPLAEAILSGRLDGAARAVFDVNDAIEDELTMKM